MLKRLALLLSLLACESASEPTLRQRGAVYPSPPAFIQAPDTVRAGMPFSASVSIVGSGTIECNRPDGASVQLGDRVARVEVFVRVPRGGAACTDDLRAYPIPVTVTFPSAGTATIRLIGLKGGAPSATLDSIERHVLVIP